MAGKRANASRAGCSLVDSKRSGCPEHAVGVTGLAGQVTVLADELEASRQMVEIGAGRCGNTLRDQLRLFPYSVEDFRTVGVCNLRRAHKSMGPSQVY